MYLVTTRFYEKKARRLDQKINLKLNERLALFQSYPSHPLLDNHALSGERRHQRSINITGDFRLIFEQINEDTIRLIDVDTHHNLYGS